MESVVRAVVMYAFIMLILRVSGKRSMGQVTTFDFVLLLIVAEVTQPALTGKDNSMTNALLIILTLVGVDILLSIVKQWVPRVGLLVDGRPLVLVDHGKPLRERMEKERIGDEDILTAARERHGLEAMDQIKYAVLERSGGISIVPREGRQASGE